MIEISNNFVVVYGEISKNLYRGGNYSLSFDDEIRARRSMPHGYGKFYLEEHFGYLCRFAEIEEQALKLPAHKNNSYLIQKFMEGNVVKELQLSEELSYLFKEVEIYRDNYPDMGYIKLSNCKYVSTKLVKGLYF